MLRKAEREIGPDKPFSACTSAALNQLKNVYRIENAAD
jgi:hypothetical protein